MPTYNQLITTAPTASGDGERTYESPELFDASDDQATRREGEAEADRRVAAGAQHRRADATWRQEDLPDHPAIAKNLADTGKGTVRYAAAGRSWRIMVRAEQ